MGTQIVVWALDGEGSTPLAGARFEVRSASLTTPKAASTDAEGRAVVDVDAGRYDVVCTTPPPAYAPAAQPTDGVEVEAGTSREVRFHFPRLAILRVEVVSRVEGSTAQPVAKATVIARRSTGAELSVSSVTGVDGSVSFALPPGGYWVEHCPPPTGYVAGGPAGKELVLAPGATETAHLEVVFAYADTVTEGAENKKGLEIPPALAASAALVVAVFASVGVSGGLLTRAVRNHPLPMAIIVVGTLAIACWVSTIAINRRKAERVLRWPVWGLTALLIFAVVLGVFSLTKREFPRVSLSSTSDGNLTTVTISATGSGLRSREGMLLQVHGLATFPEAEEVMGCQQNRFPEYPLDDMAHWPGQLLLWERGGSDADGKVALESKIQVPANSYEGLCAWAVLRDRDSCTWAFLCDRWDRLCDRWDFLHNICGGEDDVTAYIRLPTTS
jgi:hypothetical protein